VDRKACISNKSVVSTVDCVIVMALVGQMVAKGNCRDPQYPKSQVKHNNSRFYIVLCRSILMRYPSLPKKQIQKGYQLSKISNKSPRIRVGDM
jgi:hypothetical protein